MIEAARERLSEFGERIDYRLSDMRESGWSTDLGGPFDAVVSAIAIHNLWDPAHIHNRRLRYRGIEKTLDSSCWVLPPSVCTDA